MCIPITYIPIILYYIYRKKQTAPELFVFALNIVHISAHLRITLLSTYYVNFLCSIYIFN